MWKRRELRFEVLELGPIGIGYSLYNLSPVVLCSVFCLMSWLRLKLGGIHCQFSNPLQLNLPCLYIEVPQPNGTTNMVLQLPEILQNERGFLALWMTHFCLTICLQRNWSPGGNGRNRAFFQSQLRQHV